MKQRLESVAVRLGLLARRPDQVRRFWTALGGPLLRRVKWQPRLAADRIGDLVHHIESGGLADREESARLLGRAAGELEDDLDQAEKSVVVWGELSTAHVAWLWRLYQLVHRAAQLVERPQDRTAHALLAAEWQHHHLEPLALCAPGELPTSHVHGIDPVIEAARAETRNLGRRRRLLQAARRLLFEAAAALEISEPALRTRRRYLTMQLVRLDRMQAAGLSADVDLVLQARQAHVRNDPQKLHVALTAMHEMAASAGDEGLTRLATSGLDRLWRGKNPHTPEEATASLERSIRETFGAPVVQSVQRAYADAPQQLPALRERWANDYDEQFFQRAEQYLGGSAAWATMCAATSADGCFDVGGASSPVHAAEANRTTIRQVRFPTQEMQLEPARGPEDVPGALIEDPRVVLPWLAAGRLLTRQFVVEETDPREPNTVKSEVRFYVLDGSASMLGPRARLRDALLLAELTTAAERLNDAERRLSPLLFYRYFNLEAAGTRRIATRDAARAAIAEVVGTIHVGGTDIQAALLDSFAQIEAARAASADLAQAQIVLVTDGEAPVDGFAVHQARMRCAGLPIGVSIIALGHENWALRQMAAEQRARGERVFYQFMDDFEIADVIEGRTAGMPIHLSGELAEQEIPAELKAIVADIEQHSRRIDAAVLEHAAEMPAAIAEVELAPGELDEAARARLEAATRDRRAVEARFLRWFPLLPIREPESASRKDDALIARVARVLAVVRETLEAAPARPLDLQADAVELIERLLLDERLLPWTYAEALRRFPGLLRPAMETVHLAAGAAHLVERMPAASSSVGRQPRSTEYHPESMRPSSR